MKFVGIDISKLSFDVALSNNGTYQTGKFDNNLKGFKSFSKWRSQFDDTFIFCMEATGVYGNNLAKFLYQDNEKVIVSNPLKTHAFTKMELCRNKTDQTDAISLAKYCEYLSTSTKLNENLYKPKSESAERLQYLVTRLEQLNKNHLQETSRLEICQDQEIKKSIRSMVRHIANQIERIKQSIKNVIAKDGKLNTQFSLLVSINAIGEKTAWAILAYLGDISKFKNSKQVSSYAGLNPKIQQSGTSINRSSLSKVGHKNLRNALYMPAIVSVRFNPLMAELYSRLKKKNKSGKLAICAVMRKLLVIAYGVLKSGKPFDPDYALTNN